MYEKKLFIIKNEYTFSKRIMAWRYYHRDIINFYVKVEITEEKTCLVKFKQTIVIRKISPKYINIHQNGIFVKSNESNTKSSFTFYGN